MTKIVSHGLVSFALASSLIACKQESNQSSTKDTGNPTSELKGGLSFQNERTDHLTILDDQTVALQLIEGIKLKAVHSPYPQGGTGAYMWWASEEAPTGSRASCNPGTRYKMFLNQSEGRMDVVFIEESQNSFDENIKGSLVCGKFVPKTFIRK
jgi:hypothetical protein